MLNPGSPKKVWGPFISLASPPVLKNGDGLVKLSHGFPKLRFLMYIVLNLGEGLIRIRSSICSTLSVNRLDYQECGDTGLQHRQTEKHCNF